jgi:hypothetical protein
MIHNHLCPNYTAPLPAANSQRRQLAVIAGAKRKSRAQGAAFSFQTVAVDRQRHSTLVIS